MLTSHYFQVGAKYFHLLRPKLGFCLFFFFERLNCFLGVNHALDYSRIACVQELRPSNSAIFTRGKREKTRENAGIIDYVTVFAGK